MVLASRSAYDGSMSSGRGERDYHTRLGWWLMIHDSATTLIIGVGAAGLLIADLIYLASRWHGFGSRFDRGFLLGFGGPLVAALAVRSAGGYRPIGSDRVSAARTAGVANSVAALIFGASLVAAFALEGHFPLGFILGGFAAIFGLFAAFSVWWSIRGLPSQRRSA